ncbi:30S ribosomal protein S8 [Halomonas beimenensis]|uniref:30S ribosomal protein S8 n=1 Tax=Halomonas beimenensis TaxID=475662 RepID=UPI00361128AD
MASKAQTLRCVFKNEGLRSQVLKDEGYVEDFSVSADAKPELTITLKYFGGKPVIEEIKGSAVRVCASTRAWGTAESIGGLGVAIVSTSRRYDRPRRTSCRRGWRSLCTYSRRYTCPGLQ